MSVGFKFTVEKYEQMIRTGILGENDPVELIRGELVPKMPIGDAHVDAVNRLNRLFNKQVNDPVVVSVQNPVVFADSEPEPDIALLLYQSAAHGKPHAPDLLLVIEVADSSLEFDRTVKLSLYAEAGVREYWIVNLLDGQLDVYRDPQPSGEYREPRVLRRGDEVEPLALAGVKIAVADIFH